MKHDEDVNFKNLEELSLQVLRKFTMAYTTPSEAKEARMSNSQFLILELLRNEGRKSSSELAKHFLDVMDETGKNIIKTLWGDLSSEEVKRLNSIFQKVLRGKQA